MPQRRKAAKVQQYVSGSGSLYNTTTVPAGACRCHGRRWGPPV